MSPLNILSERVGACEKPPRRGGMRRVSARARVRLPRAVAAPTVERAISARCGRPRRFGEATAHHDAAGADEAGWYRARRSVPGLLVKVAEMRRATLAPDLSTRSLSRKAGDHWAGRGPQRRLQRRRRNLSAAASACSERRSTLLSQSRACTALGGGVETQRRPTKRPALAASNAARANELLIDARVVGG